MNFWIYLIVLVLVYLIACLSDVGLFPNRRDSMLPLMARSHPLLKQLTAEMLSELFFEV